MGPLAFQVILRVIHTTWEKEPAKVKGVANGVYAALSRLREGEAKIASGAVMSACKSLRPRRVMS